MSCIFTFVPLTDPENQQEVHRLILLLRGTIIFQPDTTAKINITWLIYACMSFNMPDPKVVRLSQKARKFKQNSPIQSTKRLCKPPLNTIDFFLTFELRIISQMISCIISMNKNFLGLQF